VSERGLSEQPQEAVGFNPSALRGIGVRHLLVRFAFGAGTSAIAAGVTLAFGARAGGLFLAFPAILAATVTLIEKDDTARAAREDARGAIVGAVALSVFAAVAAALFAVIPGGAALVAATASWTAVALGAYFVFWG
jgi:hypothetical protein